MVHGAGLSPSLIDILRSKKEFKTNLNLFADFAVVWGLRILDFICEQGDLSDNDREFFQAYVFTGHTLDCDAIPIARLLKKLRNMAAHFKKVSTHMAEYI